MMLTAILLLGGITTPGAQTFSGYAFRSLVEHNAHKKFLLIHDEPEAAALLNFPNVEHIHIDINRKSFLYRWLLKKKIASLLIQKGASIFLTMRPFRNTRIPQYYLHTGAIGKKLLKNLQQLTGIIVPSEALRAAMVSIGIDAARIAVVYGGHSLNAADQPVEDESSTREKYTGGKQYFLVKEGPGDNLMFLLKAFSKFKKRQKSEMKLVVLKSSPEKKESFYSILETYKYRNDVTLLSPDNNTPLIAAAYGLIISEDEGLVLNALDAMAVSVPVIASHNSPVKEWGEGIALYYTKDNIDDLADKLMNLYKNEDLWSRLAVAGKEIAIQYSWKRTSETIGNMLYKNEHD